MQLFRRLLCSFYVLFIANTPSSTVKIFTHFVKQHNLLVGIQGNIP